MVEKLAKWPSGHRKTEKSGHRLAAEKTLFPRRWYEGMISADLEVIWEMSVSQGHPLRLAFPHIFCHNSRMRELPATLCLTLAVSLPDPCRASWKCGGEFWCSDRNFDEGNIN